MRNHLVKTAEFWFNAAKGKPNKYSTTPHEDALLAMENAYNHVENALAYILDKVPGAREEFDKVNNKKD